MTSANKNKAGGHSHTQQDRQGDNQQGDSRKSGSADDSSSGKGEEVKESFGKSGAKDSH